MEKENTYSAPVDTAAVSLPYIFLTFLKLGATAFGGYMSLVAMVQKQLVELDKKLKEEELLDAISLTSVLPGPVAVNVIVYVGYRLRGIGGAALAFAGIILPSFLLVVLLSRFYFSYGNVPAVKALFMGITPAITALILTVAAGMARKTMKNPAQWAIGGISAALLVWTGGFALTFGLIGASGVAGYFLFRLPAGTRTVVFPAAGTPPFVAQRPEPSKPSRISIRFSASLLLLLLLGALLWGGLQAAAPLPLRILSVFAGSSLTLFGGGYVVIPALHELFVENLHWLSGAEFADGIAIGQITPGPIFITATFIGYKVAGWSGAFLATLAMFAPPALVTVLAARFVNRLAGSAGIQAAMKGIRAAVIGMIFASAFIIGQSIDHSAGAVALFLLSLVISGKYAVSPVYLIPGAGAAGLLLF